MKQSILPILFSLALILSPMTSAEEGMSGTESWLPNLTTDTPEEGFALAVKLSRMGVKTTQPDINVLKTLREAYARDPDSLIAASHVIAVHFRTIATANNYWRD